MRQLGLDYLEIGPPGRERIAVVVSDEPVLKPRVLGMSGPENPFVKPESGDVADLCETLSTGPHDSWSAGVLSFLVG